MAKRTQYIDDLVLARLAAEAREGTKTIDMIIQDAVIEHYRKEDIEAMREAIIKQMEILRQEVLKLRVNYDY